MSVPGPDGEIYSSCIIDPDGNRVCLTNRARTVLVMEKFGLATPPKPTPSKPGRSKKGRSQ